MAWEARRGDQRYYYRSRRIGGRVIKQYVGRGDLANAIAYMDRYERERRTEPRERLRSLQGESELLCVAVEKYCAAVDAVTAAALTEAGCHRQKRGRWRKQRMTNRTTKQKAELTETRAETSPDPLLPVPSRKTPLPSRIDPAVARGTVFGEQVNAQGRFALDISVTHPDVGEVFIAAQRGDKSALPALHSVLDALAKPGEPVPDALTHAAAIESRILRNFFSGDKDLLLLECRRREFRAVRDDVAGPNPSPLEKLLAERIGLCYMHVQFCENCYQNSVTATVEGRGSQAMIQYSSKKLDAAQKRYLAAIKTLAQVQRLKLPAAALQVNIGGQHVHAENVALPG